jgi:hypothetical protein
MAINDFYITRVAIRPNETPDPVPGKERFCIPLRERNNHSPVAYRLSISDHE